MPLDNSHSENETRIGGRLRRAARTTLLLLGAVSASLLMVDLPAPLGSPTGGQALAESPVRASDKWIALGKVTPTSLQNQVTAVDPGALPGERKRTRRKPRSVQLASLSHELPDRPGPSLSGGAIRWNASPACLNAALRQVLGEVAASFGPVTVNSTCRSHEHNAKVGGAKHSQHLGGNAADFHIGGNPSTVLAFLSSNRSVGGVKHYGGGVFHIDTGPRRSW